MAAHPANSTSKVGINKFADLTDAEWKKMLGYKGTQKKNASISDLNPIQKDLADSVDWREKGAVTPVKD